MTAFRNCISRCPSRSGERRTAVQTTRRTRRKTVARSEEHGLRRGLGLRDGACDEDPQVAGATARPDPCSAPRPDARALTSDLAPTRNSTNNRRSGCGRGTPVTRTTCAASAASRSTRARPMPSSPATTPPSSGASADTRFTCSASPAGSTRRRSSGAPSAAARGSSSN